MSGEIKKTINFSHLAEIIGLAIIYFVTAKVCQLLAIPPGNVTPIWIPSGIILIIVLIRGYWIWPGIWLGAFVGNVWAYIDIESTSNIFRSLFSGSMNGFGDSLGAVLGAYLIQRYTHVNNPLHRSGHIIVFLVAGVALGALVSATFGVTSLAIAGFIEWNQFVYTWLTWSIGDAVGILIIAPVILALTHSIGWKLKPDRYFELFLYVVVLISALVLCLGLPPIKLVYQVPLFLTAPILIWSVFRLGEIVTFIGILVVSSVAAIATTLGVGPFAHEQVNVSLIELQLFLAVMSITILILNSTVRERKDINQKLSELYHDLEHIVEERTRELSEALKTQKKLNLGLKKTTNELNVTQKQLLHSQKMEALGTLAGGIAHDFNNMLNVIIGNADLVLNKLPADSSVEKHIQAINSAALRAAKLVKQILTFSRMKSDNYVAINLVDVVNDAVKMVRASLSSAVDIEVSIEDEYLPIIGDSTQINQILLNLCTNAYHAISTNGGLIKVVLKKVDQCPSEFQGKVETCILLSISDNGQGISADIVDKIFDPFFTTKEVGKGTGLGLSVVHGIVESHHGIIDVKSELERGTIIDVYFPMTQQSIGDIIIDKAYETSTQSNKHILVIDDEPEITSIYQQFLEAEGYRVSLCSNGEDALEFFKKHADEIDLIITDQSMPKMSGKELSEKILSIRPECKIILATGYIDVLTENDAYSIGIKRLLIKPVKLSDLRINVVECLEEKVN